MKRIRAGEPRVTIGGKQVKTDDIEKFEVRGDMDEPDLTMITLSNIGGVNTAQFQPGDAVEVAFKLEDEEEDTLFKGKLTGIEAQFDIKRALTVDLWAMCDLHKLARERRTRTFVKQTVQQVVSQIAQENGLSADFGKEPPTLKNEHLHQFNVSDLGYCRWLAARTGREIKVEEGKLLFRKPEKDKGPVAELDYTEEGKGTGLDFLSLHQSAANQVNKVTVLGWDPAKKEAIVGQAQAAGSPLGSTTGGGSFGDSPELSFFDVPVRSKEEADQAADSILQERLMRHITGHGIMRGNGKVKVGEILKLTCSDQQFDGKYQIVGVQHTYSHAGGALGSGAGMGGYVTHFTLRRDASG